MRHLSNLGLGTKILPSFTPSTPQKRDDDRNCNKANTDLDSTRQGLSTDILIIYFACGVLQIRFGGRLTIRVAMNPDGSFAEKGIRQEETWSLHVTSSFLSSADILSLSWAVSLPLALRAKVYLSNPLKTRRWWTIPRTPHLSPQAIWIWLIAR